MGRRHDSVSPFGVVSADIDRSEAFYAAVFDRPPQSTCDGFISFGIAGGLFAIGRNAVPYIRVTDIHGAHAHVQAVVPGAIGNSRLIGEGPISLFKHTDPDGNVIECYALSAP